MNEAQDSSCIRPLTRADLPAWHALQQQGLPDPFSLAALQGELHNRLARHLGLFVERHLLAACLSWLVVDELQVLQVVVAEDARRRGVGSRLVDHALTRARAAGAVTATLEVRRSNTAAIRLYEALGFGADGARCSYYPDGEDAILMRVDLLSRQAHFNRRLPPDA